VSRSRALKFEVLLVLPLLLAGLALVACNGDDDDDVAAVPGEVRTPVPETDANVEVLDNEFSPGILTVRAGTTVAWVWRGENEHSVRGTEANWVSPVQRQGSFEFTFDFPGEYSYSCEVHGAAVMSGIINVTP
jgi:plastocyanin